MVCCNIVVSYSLKQCSVTYNMVFGCMGNWKLSVNEA